MNDTTRKIKLMLAAPAMLAALEEAESFLILEWEVTGRGEDTLDIVSKAIKEGYGLSFWDQFKDSSNELKKKITAELLDDPRWLKKAIGIAREAAAQPAATPINIRRRGCKSRKV